MRILVLEDDPDLATLIAMGLRDEAYAVDVASTVAEAEGLLVTVPYDLACIDLGLPDGDGLELLEDLSSDHLIRPRRVLLLTARDGVADRVAGLDAGADDYLTKPFAFEELLARLRALGRRADAEANVLSVGDIELDQTTHRVARAGRDVELTAREFSLLRYLMTRAGDVVSSEELLEHVWDRNADPFTSSVRVILSRVRRKLGDPDPIATVTGAGYRLEANDA